MSRQINQPVNQVRLTNVAVVRMNRGGKRFEVACYRNKIINYRQKIETDLSEVLQTDRVFTNVSKGQVASSQDLLECFQTTDEEAICKIILERGTSLQISDLERAAQIENTQKEIATLVSRACVDPKSGRPYTETQIRDAMKEAEFCVQTTKSVKQQFLECVKLLREKGTLDIQRAKMELCVVLPDPAMRAHVSEQLTNDAHVLDFISGGADVESVGTAALCRIQFLIDPGFYRIVDKITKQFGGRLEIMRHNVTEEGDANLENEVLRKKNNNQVLSEAANLKKQVDYLNQIQNDASESSDDNVEILARKLKATNMDTDENDNEGATKEANGAYAVCSEDEGNSISHKRDKQKQKKSKKAKRREKEEAEERDARLKADNARRENRASRFDNSTYPLVIPANQSETASSNYNTAPSDGNLKSCNTCGGSFTPSQYRTHFKSDWHRYNVKLKLKGVPAIGEQEFQTCDAGAFFDDTP